ncbi:MAG: FkbM family methyltransferase [Phycisphaerales bacterium]
MIDLEIRNGKYYWPKYAKPDNGRYLRHAETDLAEAIKFAPGRGVVVQAGGHVGMWPMWLTHHFGHVVTFEPHPTNYAALAKNLATHAGPGRFTANEGALSDMIGDAVLKVSKNAGGHSLGAGSNGEGEFINVKTFTIDFTMGDCPVDFICLDIEGHELPALQGAQRVLRRDRPLLMIEMRGHGIKKGRGNSDDDIIRYLDELEYEPVKTIRNDRLFMYRGNM